MERYGELPIDDAAAAGPTESVDDLGRIQGAAQHLLRLIDDVLGKGSVFTVTVPARMTPAARVA
jgi:hypothetical protein